MLQIRRRITYFEISSFLSAKKNMELRKWTCYISSLGKQLLNYTFKNFSENRFLRKKLIFNYEMHILEEIYELILNWCFFTFAPSVLFSVRPLAPNANNKKLCLSPFSVC